MNFRAIFAYGLIFLSMSSAALELDQEALIAAGEKTRARLTKETAAWTAVIAGEQGTRVLVDVVQAPDKRRIFITIDRGADNLVPVANILEKNGKWYVNEPGGISGIYRPYEAPFDLPVLYQFLFDDRLLTVSRDSVKELGVPENQEGNLVAFRAPLSKSRRKAVESQIRKFDIGFAKISEEKRTPNLLAMKEKLLTALNNGVQVQVDIRQGYQTQYGSANKWIQIERFRFLDGPFDEYFEIKGKEWKDYSAAPTREELNDCIVANNWAQWTPQVKATLPADIRLLNLKTNALRRVPIQALEAGGDCFLKDRSKLIVRAISQEPAGLRLYEVDLITGKSRAIGRGFPDGAIILDSKLSPDGKTLAVQSMADGDDMLSFQIHLLDLATDALKPLGTPCDQAFLNWLPDGSGFLLERRTSVDMNLPSKGALSILSMDGKRTDIREGKHPVLLADGKSILFEGESRSWQVCDFQGKILRKLTNGRPWYLLETLTLSGDKVVGNKYAQDEKGAEPIYFDPETGADTPLTTVRGFWHRQRAR